MSPEVDQGLPGDCRELDGLPQESGPLQLSGIVRVEKDRSFLGQWNKLESDVTSQRLNSHWHNPSQSKARTKRQCNWKQLKKYDHLSDTVNVLIRRAATRARTTRTGVQAMEQQIRLCALQTETLNGIIWATVTNWYGGKDLTKRQRQRQRQQQRQILGQTWSNDRGHSRPGVAQFPDRSSSRGVPSLIV